MHTIIVASDGPRTKDQVSRVLGALKAHGQGLGHDEAEIGIVRVVVFDVMGIQGIQWRTPLEQQIPYIYPKSLLMLIFSLDRHNLAPDSTTSSPTPIYQQTPILRICTAPMIRTRCLNPVP